MNGVVLGFKVAAGLALFGIISELGILLLQAAFGLVNDHAAKIKRAVWKAVKVAFVSVLAVTILAAVATRNHNTEHVVLGLLVVASFWWLASAMRNHKYDDRVEPLG